MQGCAECPFQSCSSCVCCVLCSAWWVASCGKEIDKVQWCVTQKPGFGEALKSPSWNCPLMQVCGQLQAYEKECSQPLNRATFEPIDLRNALYNYIDKWLQTPWLTRINSVCYSSSFTFHYNRLWLLYSTQTHIQSRACGRDLGKGLESFHQSAFLFREEVVPGQQFAPTMSLGITLICFSYFIWYSYDIHMMFIWYSIHLNTDVAFEPKSENVVKELQAARQNMLKIIEIQSSTMAPSNTPSSIHPQYTPPVDTPSRHPCICQRKSLTKHRAVCNVD